MSIKVGDKLPSVTLPQAPAAGPKPLASDDFFGGKPVALFALPGFVDKADEIKGKGVDVIACLSVNDAFVMKAWGEAQSVGEDIVMLADGSGDFTKAVGLEMDARKFGMGERSQRYSMIVEDGVVKSLNVEAPGEFKVSSADYLVAQL